MRESQIERPVCRFARDHGILVLKLAGPGLRGQPDRLFLKDGKSAFVEFKRPGQRPTPLQMKWLEDLCREKFHATWIDDVEKGKEWIRGVFGL